MCDVEVGDFGILSGLRVVSRYSRPVQVGYIDLTHEKESIAQKMTRTSSGSSMLSSRPAQVPSSGTGACDWACSSMPTGITLRSELQLQRSPAESSYLGFLRK